MFVCHGKDDIRLGAGAGDDYRGRVTTEGEPRLKIRWQDRQRVFQARVLTNANVDVHLRTYRTFQGSPHGRPRPATSRPERAFVVVIGTLAIVAALMLGGAPRELAAGVAGLGGGMALVAGLAGPDPRQIVMPSEPLLAIYARRVTRGDLPEAVTQITAAEMARLGPHGYGSLVGTARPGGTLGIFIDDYLVWARTPPRSGIRVDPPFGTD